MYISANLLGSYDAVLHILLAGILRLDLDLHCGSAHRHRRGYAYACVVAEIRSVDEGVGAGAVMGESGV